MSYGLCSPLVLELLVDAFGFLLLFCVEGKGDVFSFE